MKIVKPSYLPVTPFGELSPGIGVGMLEYIERMGRISHRSEDRQEHGSWRKFIQTHVLEHGDWSITEHASFTVIFRLDRGTTHELVRHRLFGFTQESTRFVNYEKRQIELEFIYPADAPKAEGFEYDATWVKAMQDAEEHYKFLISKGWRPQEARSVLPNALASTIAVTGNVRNWRHAMLMRTTKETNPDFRTVMIPLLADLKLCVPLIFDDIEPNGRQAENLKKGR